MTTLPLVLSNAHPGASALSPSFGLTLAAEPLALVSWWAPVAMVVCLSGWAWVVSTIYDKDAARFYLPRRRWNMIHLAAGVLAVAVVLALPLPAFITLPVMLLLLVVDLGAYAIARNADPRVGADHKWTMDFSKLKEQREAKKKGKKVAGISMVIKGPSGELAPPERETPEYDIRVAAEELIQKLVDARGIQMDIAPAREGAYVSTALVDGVRQPLEQMPAARAIAIIDLYKTAAGLDVADRRRKLSGDFKLGHAGGTPTTPFRLTTMGGSGGVQMSLMLDPEGQVRRKLDELGLLPNQKTDLESLIEERKGVVLAVAPPDNGRTSTLYAIIRSHDAYTSNVQTIEIEPQGSMEGVRHNKFDPAADGAEFSTTVRSILRRDPNVVAIAEMPDEATAKEAARAEHDRLRVYLSFRSDGALAAIQAYCRAVGDQRAAANSLHGVVAQRLVRRLCENCRAPFQPTPDMLKKLGLPADTKQIHRKSGQVLVKDKPQTCPVCAGGGFFGQVGIFEVYPIGPAEREMIAGNDFNSLKAAFRQKKQPSLQSAALQHVILGDTSVEEVVRVTQPAGAPAPVVAPAAGEEKKPGAKPATPGAPGVPGAPAAPKTRSAQPPTKG